MKYSKSSKDMWTASWILTHSHLYLVDTVYFSFFELCNRLCWTILLILRSHYLWSGVYWHCLGICRRCWQWLCRCMGEGGPLLCMLNSLSFSKLQSWCFTHSLHSHSMEHYNAIFSGCIRAIHLNCPLIMLCLAITLIAKALRRRKSLLSLYVT